MNSVDSAAWPSQGLASEDKQPMTLNGDVDSQESDKLGVSFLGLILFMIGYYNRPEDWLPGGRFLPFALIGGILAIGGYFVHAFSGGGIKRWRESRVILALLIWFILTIPLAEWKGGSFQIVKDNISKIMLISIAAMHAINSISRLRKLLTLQVVSIALMALFSHMDSQGRLEAPNTAFRNSNDFAVIISLTVPFTIFFILTTQSKLKKLAYAILMLMMVRTLVFTFSRTGFLALAMVAVVFAWQLGVKQGHQVRVLAGTLLLFVLFTAFAPPNYGKLIASIYDSDVDTAGEVRKDAGDSREARQGIMKRGLEVTIEHPIFGVGPNGFERISGSWHVAHNTYLQFSSEAGIPSLILFLLLVRYTFLNLRDTERISQPRSELWYLTCALRASFAAFLVGAFFTNFAYTFFPYFVIAYAAAVHQIAINRTTAVSSPRTLAT